MQLRFLVIDPGTDNDHCPAMQVDEMTGDLVFVGETVTDPNDLAQLQESSGISPNESGVRVPARMRKVILEALRELEDDPTVP
ncbi:hypothetical protein [Bailinhaonella thermotolerans]|uniref:Uncharacterized protein n=1 Tax=Bailinhaonella thermotolerans TaxID=1070861 RepID=A0A3A4ALZ4_9ACTN|nr:hypothetical protein [Bailinhaonella thermotolerans]RJL29941.1 hypothetical protein D5H75_23600 [Bailinhaonella thermotolerans]